MRNTRWKIEERSITLYPNGVYKVIAIALAVVFTGICIYFQIRLKKYGEYWGVWPYLVYLLPCLILYFGGNTRIVFDGNAKNMKRLLFGRLNNKTVPFDQIAGIDSWGAASGFNYRVFLKRDRHGKGIPISSGYRDAKDKAAIVFRQEIIPQLEQLIRAGQEVPASRFQANDTTGFTYYKHNGSIYTMKETKLFALIMGLIFLSWGIYNLLTGKIHQPKFTDSLALVYFPLLLGTAALLACFSSFTLDKEQRKITFSYLGGLIKKQYTFGDFIKFHIVRKTTNLIYSGTDVRMELLIPDRSKSRIINVRSFGNTRKIERFLEETGSIME